MTSADGASDDRRPLPRTDRARRRRRHRPDGDLHRDGGGAGRRDRARWDADPATTARAAALGGFSPATSLEDAVRGADLVVVCTPIPTIAAVVAAPSAATTGAIVTDVGSIKARCPRRGRGGSPRTTSRASCRVTRWAAASAPAPSTPHRRSSTASCGCSRPRRPPTSLPSIRLESWVEGLGARPVRMPADRHDRLVAFVSHLPQVASTALMSLAATEEADEPEILLLAAGGFRDLTRLAASDAALWSAILLANRERIAEAIDLYVDRLQRLRDDVVGSKGEAVESTFAQAKDGSSPARHQAAGAGRRGRVPGGDPRPAWCARRAHGDPRGGPREHRGPSDRALARGRARDRASHGGGRAAGHATGSWPPAARSDPAGLRRRCELA